MIPFRLGICQMNPGADHLKNLRHAVDMVSRATDRGAGLVVLPEMFYIPYEFARVKSAAADHEKVVDELSECAKANGVFLCAGSIAVPGARGLENKSFFFDGQGRIIHSYSKCHLYDVSLKNSTIRESEIFTPGESVEVVKTTLGCFGVLICFDIRFPEMTRTLALKGAEMVLVPSVFNQLTGSSHWHLLMRTRAMENQVFVAGVSQARNLQSTYQSYGHSLVADPWGAVIAEALEGEETLIIDISPQKIDETRVRMPLLSLRRPELYR